MFDISEVEPGRWYAWVVTPGGGWAHEWPTHAAAAAWVRGMWAVWGEA